MYHVEVIISASIPYIYKNVRLFFENKFDNLNCLIAICVVYILKTLYIFFLENNNNKKNCVSIVTITNLSFGSFIIIKSVTWLNIFVVPSDLSKEVSPQKCYVFGEDWVYFHPPFLNTMYNCCWFSRQT